MILFRSIFAVVRSKNLLHRSSGNITAYMIGVRSISSMEVTKNITLLSRDKKHGKIVNLKLENAEDKPLVIMLSWLMAKRKHISKFADFYIEKGFDVINVSVTPWQLLWPMKGTQIVARDILTFLEKNRSFSPLVLHGFSVGGYLWSEALVQLAAEQHRYQHILDRTVGQVWDSLADITEIPEGFPFAVFPRNKVLQSALRQYILYHMKTFDKVATCHYVRASQMFHTNIVRSPALFFLSKTDPIGSERSNLRAKESWESMGMQVSWKCWDDSPHVMHFLRHREEYLSELTRFIDSLDMSVEREDQKVLSQVKAKL